MTFSQYHPFKSILLAVSKLKPEPALPDILIDILFNFGIGGNPEFSQLSI